MVENSVILPYYHQVDATRIRNLIANGANSMKKCYTYSRSLLKNFLQMLSFVFGFISTVCDARIISVHRTASWSSMNRSLYCKNTRGFHFKSNQNGNNEPFQLRLHTYLIPFHKNTRAIGTSPSSSWSELSENECKCFDEIFKLFFFSFIWSNFSSFINSTEIKQFHLLTPNSKGNVLSTHCLL